jgi:hypothetical protein
MIEQITGIVTLFILVVLTWKYRHKIFKDNTPPPVEEITHEMANKLKNRPLPDLISDVNNHYQRSHTGGGARNKRK